MPFVQSAPEIGNQYLTDRVLRGLLDHALPPGTWREVEPSLVEMGDLAATDLFRLQFADRLNEPRLTQWDAWGSRIDRVEITPLWQAAERIASERGLVAAAYDETHGEFARCHQFALAYLFIPSTDLYGCPLAMSDGAARVLLASGNARLIDRALPHLLARDPAQFWTSGQWMTESTGGSDVGMTETIARRDGAAWRLSGRKWFTSAINSQMALTLARPEGNADGGKGLALFYVESRDAAGRPNRIRINRLKDKLGTRKVPTAELDLDGTPAELVMTAHDGIRNIAPLLNITRTWNGVTAAALMRRGLVLSRDYARRRLAFGAPLAQKPLHLDTLAGLEAEFQGALHFAFYVAGLLGRSECGRASEQQLLLLRTLVPLLKLTTARQAVAVLGEIIESFGGAGYVEDTGLPVLLRDAHVLPIWEGTTDVLSLDVLRVLTTTDAIGIVQREARVLLQGVHDADLLRISAIVERTLEAAAEWLRKSGDGGGYETEAGARRLALTLGRTFELALLAWHAQWMLDHRQEPHALAAARRFAGAPVNLMVPHAAEDARMLFG